MDLHKEELSSFREHEPFLDTTSPFLEHDMKTILPMNIRFIFTAHTYMYSMHEVFFSYTVVL